jgi:hypothetical protein
MKDAVLLELATKWEHDAKTPERRDGSEEAVIPNAVEKGRREGKRECADALRMLVDMLGDVECPA